MSLSVARFSCLFHFQNGYISLPSHQALGSFLGNSSFTAAQIATIDAALALNSTLPSTAAATNASTAAPTFVCRTYASARPVTKPAGSAAAAFGSQIIVPDSFDVTQVAVKIVNASYTRVGALRIALYSQSAVPNQALGALNPVIFSSSNVTLTNHEGKGASSLLDAGFNDTAGAPEFPNSKFAQPFTGTW